MHNNYPDEQKNRMRGFPAPPAQWAAWDQLLIWSFCSSGYSAEQISLQLPCICETCGWRWPDAGFKQPLMEKEDLPSTVSGPESVSARLSALCRGPLFFMTPGNRQHMGDPDRMAAGRRRRSALCRRNGNPIRSYAFSSGRSWPTRLSKWRCSSIQTSHMRPISQRFCATSHTVENRRNGPMEAISICKDCLSTEAYSILHIVLLTCSFSGFPQKSVAHFPIISEGRIPECSGPGPAPGFARSHLSLLLLRRSLIFIARARDLEIGARAGVLRTRAGGQAGYNIRDEKMAME